MAKFVKLEKANWANLESANLQDPKMSYSFNNMDLGLPSVHIEVRSMEEIDYQMPGIRASNNLMDYDIPTELGTVDQKSFEVNSELQERENINFLRYMDTSTEDSGAVVPQDYNTKTKVPEREGDENSYQPWTADPDWTADGWRDGNDTERESGWSGDPDNRFNKTYAKFMGGLVPEIEDLVNNWNTLFGGDPSKVQFNKSLYNTKLRYILQPEETHSWSDLWGRIAAVWKARDVNIVIKKLTEVLQKDTKDKLLPPLVSKLKDEEVTDIVEGVADFGRTLAIQAMIKKFNNDVSRPGKLGWPEATEALGYIDGARLPNHYQQMNLQSNPKGKKAHPKQVENKLLSNGDTSKERKSLSNYPNVKPDSKSSVSEKKDILNGIFEYNIDTLLSQKFLELSSAEIFEEMFGKDPALTSNAFVLYRMKDGENSEPEMFDFRIQSFKVPGLVRATTDINYANAVMTVPSTDYGTRKNMIETNIILDKPMKVFGKLLETVGVGLKDEDWLNLSEGFDLDYKDIGDVYLQVIPGWYISKETNQWVGDRKNWEDIEDKGKYPLFVFKKFRFRTVGTEFGFNAKTDGSVTSLKVNVTFQRVYQTTKGGKEYFNKLLKEKYHSIDEFL